jgi:NifB/MoaA-like Fe-S oxidoreductase
VEVHGQVVVCPGINDGPVLEDTLAGVLDVYPELRTVACVPLGVSRYSTEASMRPHTIDEAAAVVDLVEEWQGTFLEVLGRRVVFVADEYYLLAERPFPHLDTYEELLQHENGIGMAAAFEAAMSGGLADPPGVQSGFFRAIDGAPALGYRAPRTVGGGGRRSPGAAAPVAILTGEYGARVLEPLVAPFGARVVPVRNDFFGGNIAVAGLLCGSDLARTLADQPEGHRYLLPDACLSGGVFLDGMTPADLPRSVEAVGTDGLSLRRALEGGR